MRQFAGGAARHRRQRVVLLELPGDGPQSLPDGGGPFPAGRVLFGGGAISVKAALFDLADYTGQIVTNLTALLHQLAAVYSAKGQDFSDVVTQLGAVTATLKANVDRIDQTPARGSSVTFHLSSNLVLASSVVNPSMSRRTTGTR